MPCENEEWLEIDDARGKAELTSLLDGLETIITRIHQDAPHAQIVLLNYYQIIPEPDVPLTGHTRVCQDLRAAKPGGAFRTDLRAQADFVQRELNGTIEAAAAEYKDVLMVDIGNLFEGHELCTADRWLFDGTWDAAHPNAAGQQQIADAVLARCEQLASDCVGR